MNKSSRQAQRSKRSQHLERLWDDLLSRQPGRIRAAFSSLDAPDQKAVIAHLQHMVSGPDWQPAQRLSAKAAIQALKTQSDQEK